MNKMREYERGREDGLSLALRIAKEGGIEALEKEIRFRNVTGVHTSLASKDLDKAAEKIKEITLDTFTVMSVAVLHDEFGFGEKRCPRYMDGINKAAEYIVDELATWPDYIAAIKEQIGLDLRIRWDGREVSA
ncbi:MAG TPA: hypothetical protein IAA26_12570 [Candidatus Blautia faecipullorum]|nr:hypothetical protein [Candidatus Blautia faecipullorum]